MLRDQHQTFSKIPPFPSFRPDDTTPCEDCGVVLSEERLVAHQDSVYGCALFVDEVLQQRTIGHCQELGLQLRHGLSSRSALLQHYQKRSSEVFLSSPNFIMFS